MDILGDFTEEHLAYWSEYECSLAQFNAPPGMEDECAPARAVVTLPRPDESGIAERVVRVAWKPSEIDLMHLAKGGTIWLSTWGGLPPHSLEVQPPS